MKRGRVIYVVIFFLFLFCTGAEHLSQTSPLDRLIIGTGDKNSCLIDAAVCQAVYNQHYRMQKFYWIKIMVIRYNDENGESSVPKCHAVCVYKLVLNGNEKLFVYDYAHGSIQVPIEFIDSPLSIVFYIYKGTTNIKNAWYVN